MGCAEKLTRQFSGFYTGECIATGWGYTKESSNPSPVLQKVMLPIVPDDKCSQVYKNINPITSDMICAGYDVGGKDACKVRSVVPSATDVVNSLSKIFFKGKVISGALCGEEDLVH